MQPRQTALTPNEPSKREATWSIAIFSARESARTLMACLGRAHEAGKGRAMIDVLVNGNRALADGVADALSPSLRNVKVWFLQRPDKAEAWNTYLHSIWTPCDVAFFIDGYAYIRPGSLKTLDEAMAHSDALAASGVPTAGRTAHSLRREMLATGGIHGNLYALRGRMLTALRARNFKIPAGIYRLDPLLGAIAAFNLDPSCNAWNAQRIAVCPEASWDREEPGFWRSVRDAYKRKMRQAQGVLENRAVRQHLAIEGKLPETLPATVADLVGKWMTAHPREAGRVFLSRPLCYFVARRLALNAEQRSPPSASPILLRST